MEYFLSLLAIPSTYVFAAAFVGGFFIYHVRRRRRMLLAKAGVDALYGVYFLMMGAHAGVYGIALAVTGGLVQVVTPDRFMRRTLLYRNIIAVILAAGGIYFVVERTSDVLPLIAVVAARFVELQSDPQRIRIGMMCGLLLWAMYSFDNGLYLMLAGYMSVMVSLLWAIIRFARESRTGVAA